MEGEKGREIKLGIGKSEGEINVITVCYKHIRKCQNEALYSLQVIHANKNVNNDLIHIQMPISSRASWVTLVPQNRHQHFWFLNELVAVIIDSV